MYILELYVVVRGIRAVIQALDWRESCVGTGDVHHSESNPPCVYSGKPICQRLQKVLESCSEKDYISL